MEPAIVASGVRKRYGKSVALAGVDLRVGAGETLGLLGRNGAGKTTLLSILSASVAADGGAVRVLGHDPNANPDAVRALVGVVPQEVALYDELSPRESLEALSRLYGASGRDASSRAAALLSLVGLSDREGSRAGTLSGGMRHRLNIALGLVHDPPVLLLDEPTSGLDPGAKAAIWDLIARLRGEGRAIVLSTHDLVEAERVSDRVLLLERGRVCASGPFLQIRSEVEEAFTGDPA